MFNALIRHAITPNLKASDVTSRVFSIIAMRHNARLVLKLCAEMCNPHNYHSDPDTDVSIQETRIAAMQVRKRSLPCIISTLLGGNLNSVLPDYEAMCLYTGYLCVSECRPLLPEVEKVLG